MKLNLRTAILAVAATLLLSACATPSRFEWGAYEGALYAYAKKPDTRPGYRTALVKAIAEGRITNRLAPGLLAELGYITLEDGDASGAIILFEEEMQAFPESRPFLQAIVLRARGQSSNAKVPS